jgi:hypothetical protein
MASEYNLMASVYFAALKATLPFSLRASASVVLSSGLSSTTITFSFGVVSPLVEGPAVLEGVGIMGGLSISVGGLGGDAALGTPFDLVAFFFFAILYVMAKIQD